MTEPSEFLDVTPSPRLLEVIGDLDLPLWQCLAELIDNAFDAFQRVPDTQSRTTPLVSVKLPTERDSLESAFIEVADNAAGMAVDSLRDALRAGYSSNERFGSLGLFGVGFNVATARLGNTTEVRTSMAGEAEWLVATIDLRELQRREHYSVPLRREPKEDIDEAGTVVTVTGLRQETHDTLRRATQRKKMIAELGDVYSFLLRAGIDGGLRENPVWLTVNSQRVIGRRPCVWSESRTVSRRGVETPAVIRVDEQLEDALACATCGHWISAPDATECSECKSPDIAMKPRRIHGWLGIQRYLDRADYGIDFLRNGRKILRQDKSIFSWIDPDTGRADPEYPIELPNGQGRIIGEIHCDHVPVSYRKHDFHRDSRAWHSVVRTLRSVGPLQPQKAKSHGYPENDSPLARLFAAFRRNDAGLNSLIPGDSKGLGTIHERAREWGRLFHEGRAEFLEDTIWYLAAEAHDRAKGLVAADTASASESEIHAVFAEAGLDDFFDPPPQTGTEDDVPQSPRPDSEPKTDAPAGTPLQTRAEYFAHLRDIGSPYDDLSGDFVLPRLDKFEFRAYGVRGEAVATESGREVPALAWMPTGGRIEAFVDEDFAVFSEYGREPRDYAIAAAAQVLELRVENAGFVELCAELTCQLPSQRQSAAALRERTGLLLGRLRERCFRALAAESGEAWNRLSDATRARTEASAQNANPSVDWSAALASGQFIRYLPVQGVADLVEVMPERLLDGPVFNVKYGTWSDATGRARIVAELASDLRALGRFSDDSASLDRDSTARAALTLRSVMARVSSD